MRDEARAEAPIIIAHDLVGPRVHKMDSTARDADHCLIGRIRFHPMFASLEHESQYSGSDIERQALLQKAWPSLRVVAVFSPLCQPRRNDN